MTGAFVGAAEATALDPARAGTDVDADGARAPLWSGTGFGALNVGAVARCAPRSDAGDGAFVASGVVTTSDNGLRTVGLDAINSPVVNACVVNVCTVRVGAVTSDARAVPSDLGAVTADAGAATSDVGAATSDAGNLGADRLGTNAASTRTPTVGDALGTDPTTGSPAAEISALGPGPAIASASADCMNLLAAKRIARNAPQTSAKPMTNERGPMYVTPALRSSSSRIRNRFTNDESKRGARAGRDGLCSQPARDRSSDRRHR